LIGGGNGIIGAVPVTLVPLDATNPQIVNNVVSTYKAASAGVTFNVGRRFSDYFRVTAGVNIEQVSSSVTVPAPYFFSNGSTTLAPGISSPISDLFGGVVSGSQALGVNAPSIANLSSTSPYNLRSIVLGLNEDTRDDVFNPRRGLNASFSEEYSSSALTSQFNFTRTTIDVAKFLPIFNFATFGLHGVFGGSTGALPPSELYTFSDQQLRGYNTVFYGTDEALFQAELRIPITKDRKFTFATFVDDGGVLIRGAQPIYNAFGVLVEDPGRFTFYPDAGIGLRFDVPQLGLRTLRLDFARGNQGFHTAFGIGQSF
jgi:outer membrane protein assembly factor BamA